MDEIPLSYLLDDDPERLLSAEARRRISKVRGESEAARWKALADAHFEFVRAGEPGDFTDYRLALPAYREAVLESIRAVLRARHREFAALDISSKRLYGILRDDIEGIVNSAKNHDEPVSDIDRRALESEFFSASYATPAGSDGSQKATPAKIDVNPESKQAKAARRRAVIMPLLFEKGWTPYRWRQEAVVGEKVITRYLAGQTSPNVESRQKLSSALGIKDLPR